MQCFQSSLELLALQGESLLAFSDLSCGFFPNGNFAVAKYIQKFRFNNGLYLKP